MKTTLAFTLLLAGAGLTHAAILETITLNLAAANPGSTLSGTFSLSDNPMVGDTAPVTLSFSDPADYSPTTLTSTITVQGGTPSGFAVVFSPLAFTNLNGVTSPLDTRDISLSAFAFAKCASFPCTATGQFQDRTPALFSSTYTIAPASTATPEPGGVLLVPAMAAALAFLRRRVRA